MRGNGISLVSLKSNTVVSKRVQIVIELADGVSVVGIGDDIKGKDAEKLSALHAIIQLRGTGAVRNTY